MLPGDGAEPHGVCQLPDPGPASAGLPVGDALRAQAQQDLLDDGHHLH